VEALVTGAQQDPEWMRSTRLLADAFLRIAEDLHQDTGPESGRDCTGCPLCRGLAAFRQVRPELTEHLAEAVEEFLTAYRRTGTGTETGVSAPGDEPGGPGGGAANATGARRRVQRIDITD
jgi:hypothetical protein